MNQEGFDDVIKNKLKGYHAQFPNADVWSAFEKASADIEEKNSEQFFDDAIRNALSEQKIALNQAHWKLLKAQLKASEERKRTVYISKILEVAAVLLIFITVLKWPVYKHPIYPAKSNAIQQKSEFAAQIHKSSNFEIITSKGPKFMSERTSTSINNATFSSKITHQIAHVSEQMDQIENKEILNYDSISLISVNHSTELLDNQYYLGNENNEAVQVNDESESQKTDWTNISSESITKDFALASLPMLSSEKLLSEYAMMVPMQYSTPIEKSKFYIGAIVTADVNLINTPFDKVYSIASYNREALNNSYGLSLSKKKGALEVESGLIYVKRSYQPEAIKEKLDNVPFITEKIFNKIEFDILNIPLNIKYHFINKPKWSAYLVAGASLNLIMNAQYAIKEVQTLNRPAPGEYLASESRLQEKPFIKGLLNNDNLNDNYFLALNLGFGIEKNLTDNTSIYIQPSYQRHVFSSDIGIGPNKDKIHTSSLIFGVKTSLN